MGGKKDVFEYSHLDRNKMLFSYLTLSVILSFFYVCLFSLCFPGLSSEFRNAKPSEKPPLPKVHVTKKPMQPKQSIDFTTKKTSAKSSKVKTNYFTLNLTDSELCN